MTEVNPKPKDKGCDCPSNVACSCSEPVAIEKPDMIGVDVSGTESRRLTDAEKKSYEESKQECTCSISQPYCQCGYGRPTDSVPTTEIDIIMVDYKGTVIDAYNRVDVDKYIDTLLAQVESLKEGNAENCSDFEKQISDLKGEIEQDTFNDDMRLDEISRLTNESKYFEAKLGVAVELMRLYECDCNSKGCGECCVWEDFEPFLTSLQEPKGENNEQS